MSVYYTVKEHLVINNNSEHPIIADFMQYRLAMLGSMLLLDEAYIDSITLTADDTAYSFSGKEITANYHNIVNALRSSENIDLAAEYGTTWRSNYESLRFFPESMRNFMEEIFQEEPKISSDVFYSVYTEADCEDGNGTLCAYGTWNGKDYNGAVEYVDINEFPESGTWQTESTSISLSIDDTANYDIKAIDRVCIDLHNSFSESEEYSLSFIDGKVIFGDKIEYNSFINEDNSIDFYLNNPRLKSAEDFHKLVRLFNELNDLASGECEYIFEFADWSGADARLITIDFDEDGKTRLKIAEIS